MKFLDRLAPILAVIGLIGVFVSIGLYLAGSALDRFAPPTFVASLLLILYYAIDRPERLTRLVSGRSLRYGGNTLAMSLAFIGIIVLLNVLGNRFNYRADLTQNQDFSLSPQTIQILQNLQTPIQVLAFYSDGQGTKEQLQDTLNSFSRYTKEIEVQYIDPQLRPGTASQYGVQYAGTTVLQAGDRRQLVMGATEGELISGILKVTRGEPKKVYVLAGHGEPALDGNDQTGLSQLKQSLESQHYTLETLTLLTTPAIPDDAAAIVIVAPTKPMLPQETAAITNYLDKGGKALVFLDPQYQVGMPELLGRYDVAVGKGVVVDVGQSLPNEPLVPAISGQGLLSSPITSSLPSFVAMPMTTEVSPLKSNGQAKYQVSPIAQSSEKSWLENDLTNNQLTYDPQTDTEGPISVAVTVQSAGSATAAGAASTGEKSTRLVVFGSSVIAMNSGFAYQSNSDIIINSVNWLAEDEDLIAVRAKSATNRRLTLTNNQSNLVLYGSVILLPLAVLGFGAWVVWGRRGK